MDESGAWSLAPAYDLTLATYPLASGYRAARILGKAGNIAIRDLRQLGSTHGVRRMDETIREVLDAVADWEKLAIDHGLSKSIVSRVGLQHGLPD